VVSIPVEKKSKLQNALKNEYIKTAIFIAILIGGMFSIWFGVKAVLRNDNPFMTVVSGSMIPVLNIGDLLVVQGYANKSTIFIAPKTASPPGDILVFWHKYPHQETILLVHRAHGHLTVDGKRYIITLGDANGGATDSHYNLTTDASLPGLPEEYVVGKVVANIPYLGSFLMELQTPVGRIIIIGLFIILLVIEFVPFSKIKNRLKLKN